MEVQAAGKNGKEQGAASFQAYRPLFHCAIADCLRYLRYLHHRRHLHHPQAKPPGTRLVHWHDAGFRVFNYPIRQEETAQ